MRWNVKRKTGQICPICNETGLDPAGSRCYLCGGFGRINSKEDWEKFAQEVLNQKGNSDENS